MLHHDRMPDGRVRITPVGEHLANQLTTFGVDNTSSHGHPCPKILATPTIAVLALTVTASLSTKGVGICAIDQGRETAVSHQNHVSTFATVAARRSAMRNVLLVAECNGAVTARAGDDLDFAFINELH